MAAAPRSLVETFGILCVSYENFKNSSKQNLEDNYKSFVRQYKEFYESIEKALPEDIRAVLQTQRKHKVRRFQDIAKILLNNPSNDIRDFISNKSPSKLKLLSDPKYKDLQLPDKSLIDRFKYGHVNAHKVKPYELVKGPVTQEPKKPELIKAKASVKTFNIQEPVVAQPSAELSRRTSDPLKSPSHQMIQSQFNRLAQEGQLHLRKLSELQGRQVKAAEEASNFELAEKIRSIVESVIKNASEKNIKTLQGNPKIKGELRDSLNQLQALLKDKQSEDVPDFFARHGISIREYVDAIGNLRKNNKLEIKIPDKLVEVHQQCSLTLIESHPVQKP